MARAGKRADATGERPMVFLNACGTDVPQLADRSSFTTFLLKRGFRGVLGTVCDIYDSVAAHFAVVFFEALLNGMTVGEAMYEARWHLMDKHGNPMGLFYTFHGNVNLQLSRPIVGGVASACTAGGRPLIRRQDSSNVCQNPHSFSRNRTFGRAEAHGSVHCRSSTGTSASVAPAVYDDRPAAGESARHRWGRSCSPPPGRRRGAGPRLPRSAYGPGEQFSQWGRPTISAASVPSAHRLPSVSGRANQPPPASTCQNTPSLRSLGSMGAGAFVRVLRCEGGTSRSSVSLSVAECG